MLAPPFLIVPSRSGALARGYGPRDRPFSSDFADLRRNPGIVRAPTTRPLRFSTSTWLMKAMHDHWPLALRYGLVSGLAAKGWVRFERFLPRKSRSPLRPCAYFRFSYPNRGKVHRGKTCGLSHGRLMHPLQHLVFQAGDALVQAQAALQQAAQAGGQGLVGAKGLVQANIHAREAMGFG